MKITDYKLLFAKGSTEEKGTAEITALVKKHLDEGWVPKGGISSMVSSIYYINYVQAMVKYESND